MTAVMYVLTLLRRLPVWAWGALAVAALALALWIGHTRAVSDAYARGRHDAAAGVTFDSTLSTRAAEVVAMRSAHTDTATRRVQKSTRTVQQAVAALPDSVRALPAVDTLVQTVGVLLTEVDSLTHAITAERAAWTERAKVDSANIYALRILATAQRDTIARLEQRPTRKQAALTAIGSLAVGFALGALR